MQLLLDGDYQILEECGLQFEEVLERRFLIIKNFPLKRGLYVYNGNPLNTVEVLVIIPPTYNSSGNDMFWTYPALSRSDGGAIPAAFGFGQPDARIWNDKEYCRWSRHYKPESWKSKVDNIQKILDRIEWGLSNPSATK